MIPFSPPRIDQIIIDEVIDTLKSGWITTGPKTKLFEKEISNYVGAKASLCLNSATAGLEIMLRWYGVGPGDEVILPAYTYSATANVIMHVGAKPVFVDVDPITFNIDPLEVKKAITNKTKVVMPVDFAGFPCDYSSLMEVIIDAKSNFRPSNKEQEYLGRILLLADAAHSIGAKYKGKRQGGIVDVAVFSFHAVKNLTTAEGGAVCLNLPEPFNNEDIYKQLCIKTLHGQNKDALAKMQKGNWRYDIVEAGFKCNMTDIQASIGRIELGRYESETLPKRKAIFDSYSKALEGKSWAKLPVYEELNGNVSSYHVYPLRIKGVTEEQRDSIIQKIFDQDVSVNVHFIPVPMMSFYKGLGYSIENYPIALKNYQEEISLPVFYGLDEIQLNQVVKAVINAVEEVL
jgi:dTDP-4-amino-4,6-dideoxygalactose transaminase